MRTTDGPVLVLAGAGSGKTRALTHRIAYLIEEKGVKPWNILAITFTNKAAGEMKERVQALLPYGGDQVWVATFHATCVRILRRYADRIGYESGFTIYDTDDAKTLMRQVMKRLELDPKMYRERTLLSVISDAKNKMITPDDMAQDAAGKYREMRIAEAYAEYQAQLKKNNAMDFDDLLCNAVELFEREPDVLREYQERFRYIMVDEYQDTNGVQFRFVELLSRAHRNICVVGDDDQSIYKFRGADIRNILDFEETFPGAHVVRLEQNYRSTKTILDAANQVISNNEDRKDKSLWTENPEGDRIELLTFDTAYDEADGIVRIMEQARLRGMRLGDCAVLYRTNAQSRAIEEKCVTRGLPYRLVGGVNFYQRKEIKDILSYLRTVENGQDDVSAMRVLNVPKRGIGATTQARVAMFAQDNDISFFDALLDAEAIPGLGKAAGKLSAFTDLILSLRRQAQTLSVAELIDRVVEEAGYEREIAESSDETEAQAREENIEELKAKAEEYALQAGEEATLRGFLEDVALVADVDSLDESEDRLTLMTLHSAKGLEFDKVIMAGMEDGLFPGYMAINDVEHPEELEEERRLAYVGITRAKKELTFTCARQRMVNGETRYANESRFLDEISPTVLKRTDKTDLYRPRTEKRDLYRSEECGRSRWDDYADYGRRGSFGGGPERDRERDRDRRDSFQDGRSGPGFGRSVSSLKSSGLFDKHPKTGYGMKKPEQKPVELHCGDRVSHAKFGIGTVREIEDGPRDTEVTVEFDTAGVRKMYASFAKLKKVEE